MNNEIRIKIEEKIRNHHFKDRQEATMLIRMAVETMKISNLDAQNLFMLVDQYYSD